MSGQGKAVLVVEDDPDLRQMMELMLDSLGYRVLAAADGREALAKVAQQMPGLILLDMRMPVMDGWEFAREFRARYDHRAPIVVVTAARDARQRADDIAAEGHLDKPFDLDDLVRVVEQHLARTA